MNVKIGELVEYVEGLKNAHRRRVEILRKTNLILADIKRETEEELDGRSQVVADLEERVKVAEENAAACLRSFKDMESQIDQSIQSAVTACKVDIRNNLKKGYGFTDADLQEIGAL